MVCFEFSTILIGVDWYLIAVLIFNSMVTYNVEHNVICLLWGLLFVAERGLLIVVASLVVEHAWALGHTGFSSCEGLVAL